MPRALLRLAIGLVALLAGPALAAEVTAMTHYVVTLGGTMIARVDISIDDDGSRYSMGLDARITGMAQLVASGLGHVASQGASTASGLVSEKFDFLTRAQGEDFTVAVTYAGRNVSSFVVTPPLLNNIDRVPIERRQLTGVNDMLAAFILKGGPLDQSLCNRKLQIFTGLERFNLALSFARDDQATSKRTGYQGPVVLCMVRYTPISGHFTTSEVTQYLTQSDRILIWYAPLAEGYYIPYRALIATTSGDLSMVLTGVDR